MERLKLNEIQKMELDILLFVKKMCDLNGLKYYLAFGTLIGAVRHKGFIPWDDDVDIIMPYEDYHRLISIMVNSEQTRYKIVSYEVNDEFTAPLPKMIDTHTKIVQNYGFKEKVELGIYVDIFVLAGAGNDIKNAEKYMKSVNKVLLKWYFANTYMIIPNQPVVKSLIKGILGIPYKIVGYKKYLDIHEDMMKKQSFYRTKYVTRFGLPYTRGAQYLWEKTDFGEGVDIEFEGYIFRAPCNYEKILKGLYGDYMKMPPKELQVSNHSAEMYKLK